MAVVVAVTVTFPGQHGKRLSRVMDAAGLGAASIAIARAMNFTRVS